MYLLDTDTLIFMLRGHERVVQALKARGGAPKALSVISYGELLYGAAKSGRPVHNAARVRRISELLPIVPADKPVVETFADLKAGLEEAGKRLDDLDLLIASTALVLNYALVTNNEKHFRRIEGLRIENWTKG